jgi:hypothetical protein
LLGLLAALGDRSIEQAAHRKLSHVCGVAFCCGFVAQNCAEYVKGDLPKVDNLAAYRRLSSKSMLVFLYEPQREIRQHGHSDLAHRQARSLLADLFPACPPGSLVYSTAEKVFI